jgi:hypothetical protein
MRYHAKKEKLERPKRPATVGGRYKGKIKMERPIWRLIG